MSVPLRTNLLRGGQKLFVGQRPVEALYLNNMCLWPDPWWDTWLDEGRGTWEQTPPDTWADEIVSTWDAFAVVKEVY